MKLYWAPRTRASRAAWLLEELGVDYEIQRVELGADDRANIPGFLAASPMGKVPALEDGDVRLAESAAICIYLADRYSPGVMAPENDAALRGPYLFWTLFAPSVIEPAMAEKFSGAKTNRVSHGWGDFDSMIAALEEGIGDKEWILGDSFSAADVMLGSSVVYMQLFGILPVSQRLSAYAERCLQRAAYIRAAGLDAD